eukprot:7384942-Pyramimonas_sp.AAC.1
MRFRAVLLIWFCASCWMYGGQQLCGFGRACDPRPTATRREYLVPPLDPSGAMAQGLSQV